MEELKPYLFVFLINTISAGMGILSKIALTNGVNTFVFVFYRMAIATFFLAPFALLERKEAPRLSTGVLVKNFTAALFGITLTQFFYFVGLDYTSPTVVSAISNSLPVITFCVAVTLRMESLNPKSFVGAIKIVGFTLCLVGVMIIAFYNGPMWMPHLFHEYSYHGIYFYFKDRGPWMKGSFLTTSCYVSWSLWIVMQGKLLEEYPFKLIVITLQCMFGMIQTFIVAITFVRDPSQWKLEFGMDLIAISYCGIVVIGIGYYLQVYVIEKKGPVFLATFSPLNMMITIMFSVIILNEAISLGSLLGGGLLMGSLYIVLWAKIKEEVIIRLPIINFDGREDLQVLLNR